jgi:hypothetical protein
METSEQFVPCEGKGYKGSTHHRKMFAVSFEQICKGVVGIIIEFEETCSGKTAIAGTFRRSMGDNY